MDFGVMMFPTDYAVAPDELATMVEERGFESLFFPEHTHIPASRETPYPAGDPLPQEYWHTHDPFVALTAAAGATERLKLATGICLIVERDPITTAKAVASLDVLCGGRFLFGVGAGWNVEEMANHGTDAHRRFSLMRERVEAMKAIWTQDEASYHGDRVNFERIWSWPKPAQKPHPPVIVGGNGARVLSRVVAYGDEWMPNAIEQPQDLRKRIDSLGELAEQAGRTRPPVSLYAAPAKPELVEGYREAGVSRYIFFLPSAGRQETEQRLDQRAALVEQAGAG